MDDQASNLMTIAATVIVLAIYTMKKKKRTRRTWVTKYLAGRPRCGVSNIILRDIINSDGHGVEEFVRLNAKEFNWLLQIIRPKVIKQDSVQRDAITPCDRLALTLRFLATGDSYSSLMYLFRISPSSITNIIPEVCDAIYEGLSDYLRVPQNEDEWYQIAKEFHNRCNFPNCIGALDGKHITLQAPKNSGSLYYNYKQTFSIVLLALVDAKCNFTYIDVGCQGRISDGGIFRNCSLYQGLLDNTIHIPPDIPLPSKTTPMPFVVVADDAFPLKRCIMKPFTGRYEEGSKERIFNYRLSRARSAVENAFGILSSVFRIFRKPLCVRPEKAIKIIRACVALHNFKRRNVTWQSLSCKEANQNPGYKYPWLRNATGITRKKKAKTTRKDNNTEAKDVRNLYAYFFAQRDVNGSDL